MKSEFGAGSYFVEAFVTGTLPEVVLGNFAHYQGDLARFGTKADEDIATVPRAQLTDDRNHLVKQVAGRPAKQSHQCVKLISCEALNADLINDHWWGVILFASYTGQRLSDVAQLRWNNLDLECGELSLVTQKSARRHAASDVSQGYTHTRRSASKSGRSNPYPLELK